jgi:hypothetical protein
MTKEFAQMIFGLGGTLVLSLIYFLMYKYHDGLMNYTVLIMTILTLCSLWYGVTGLVEYVNTLPSGIK